jgi:hypothetical protein
MTRNIELAKSGMESIPERIFSCVEKTSMKLFRFESLTSFWLAKLLAYIALGERGRLLKSPSRLVLYESLIDAELVFTLTLM